MIKKAWLKSNYKKLGAGLLALVILAPAGFWFYVQAQTYPAEAELAEAIQANDALMIIEERNHYILAPHTIDYDKIPIIYYPGGLVAPEAYLYKMGKVAVCLETTIYLIKAPFNVAIFDVNAAGRIIDRYALGEAWVGGHSLGGISAGRFVAGKGEKVFGLFLFGSYCDQDINDYAGHVVSVMGLQDQIINWNNYEQAKTNIPPTAVIMEIEGLNHSDFGNYELQKDDGISALNNKEVIEIICSVFHKDGHAKGDIFTGESAGQPLSSEVTSSGEPAV